MSRRTGYITIDISEVMSEIDDYDLLQECADRKLSVEPNESTDMDIVREAYAALERGHVAEAKSILDRLIFPKWRSAKLAEQELARARKA